MSPLRILRATRRTIAISLLPIHLAGCARWVPVTQPIPAAVEQHPKSTLRVTLTDGRAFELSEVRVSADSLVGLHTTASSPSGVPESWDVSDTVAVALADISRLEIQKGGGSGPAIVVGALVLIVVVVVVATSIKCTGCGLGP